ncbi:MAG: DUF3450 domain-containing protein [Thalassolituus maritimus]|nr:MAG: DUF3450 domain-containing protein [Thalassolituus maritimus]
MNRFTLPLAASILMFPLAVGADTDSASKMVLKTDENSAAVQRKINALDDSTRDKLEETRQLLARAEQLALYNTQMEAIIANQEEEKLSLDQQIEDINDTEQGILPLMQLMLSQLEADINTGLPFLKEERAVRLAKLKASLGRADVTVSEKFRRVLEALQIEVDYGRTLERYRENEDGRAFDYLRIGNVALYRRSLDAGESWMWVDGAWRSLSDDLAQPLERASRVAEQSVAPQLIVVPMSTPENSSSDITSLKGGE